MSGRHRAMLVTPIGTGAIAVIRVVGPDPWSTLGGSFSHARGAVPKPGGRWVYGRMIEDHEVLDDVLVSLEPGAGGQQALDISCHGGVRVVERILSLLERGGAEIIRDHASALDEYWQPAGAFEREAMQALAGAKTRRAARYAARMRTDLPGRLDEICRLLISNPACGREMLTGWVGRYESARVLLQGATLALAGPPNSGKSTLLNRLLGREAAVTSPIPGTTRDWVCESVEFEGVPFELVDTAGRHGAGDALERLAVDMGAEKVREADGTIWVFDGSAAFSEARPLLPDDGSKPGWVVVNKSDLGLAWSREEAAVVQAGVCGEPIFVSARSGEGCDLLVKRVLESFGLLGFSESEPAFFTGRQAALAREAIDAASPARAAQIIGLILEGET